MLIRNKETREEFHAPSGIAKALIATGAVEEVVQLPPPEITVSWSTQRGRFISDFECPPLVTWSASNGEKGYAESTKGTAHKSARVFIPGARPNTCPGDVAARYLELFAEWQAKSKKKNGEIKQPPVERVSAHTPVIKGVSPYSGAGRQPWLQELEFRGNK